MKVHFALILASAVLPVACGQITTADIQAAKDALSSMSAEDQAANDLYLDDAIDSAAEDSSSSSGSTEEEAAEVEDDVKSDRLVQMAEMLFTRLDTDSSGSLSLEEFLVGPEKRAEEKALDAEKLATIKAKMTEEFNASAGEDKLLSKEELQALLKSAAPRIGRHRHENCPGQKEERIEKSSADLVKEYDKDGDGKLSTEELEALRAAQKAEFKDFAKNRGPGRGGEGHGPKRGGESEGKDDDDSSESDDDSESAGS